MRRCWFLLLLVLAAAPAQAAGFSDWAAIIVAGDNHSSDGKPTEVFDNGRRDVAAELVKMGFSPDYVVQFSAQRTKYPNEAIWESTQQEIANRFGALTRAAKAGCFVYFTSHGSPDGILVGGSILSPASMAKILDDTCGTRPTVAVMSACFSGAFKLALWNRSDTRFVFTAARADRTSFGCGATDQYTFFDACFLRSLPGAGDFEKAAAATQACVSTDEQKVGVQPSEPQLIIGDGLMAKLPGWTPFAVAEKTAPGKTSSKATAASKGR